MLKILQARLQQYVNRELPDVQAGLRNGRGTRDQIANICWIIEKSKRIPEKHLLLLYWLAKAFDSVDHIKLWKILKEMGIPYNFTCFLRNLYAGQEATVSTRHRTMELVPNWERSTSVLYIVILLIYLIYRVYRAKSMPDWIEAQDEIKITGRHINNFRYADDTTLIAESKEELKSLLMKVKE